MSYKPGIARIAVLVLGLLAVGLAEPVEAQGRGRGRGNAAKPAKPRVTVELALSATRDVLTEQGFDVVRVEQEGDLQIVYYRRGNRGRGRGGGPLVRLVLRKGEDSVQIVEAPVEIKVEIEIKLGIRIR